MEFKMTEQKRNVEFIANNTQEALDIKKSLEDLGFVVKHTYTGSSVPILTEEHHYTVGSGNIRRNYLIK
jgi:hypothetical protein